jgi:hypothetical protein
MRLFKTILCQLLVICVNSQKCFVNNDIINSNNLFTYQGNVYDITNYNHPGGQGTLNQAVGNALENFVNMPKYDFHLTSNKFTNDLNNMLVGVLKDTCSTVPQVTNPPVTNPPVTNPPVTNPPVTNPPVTNPPVTNPPVTNPPVTDPPVTNPSVTNPQVTNPPATVVPLNCIPLILDLNISYIQQNLIGEYNLENIFQDANNLKLSLTQNIGGTRISTTNFMKYGQFDIIMKSPKGLNVITSFYIQKINGYIINFNIINKDNTVSVIDTNVYDSKIGDVNINSIEYPQPVILTETFNKYSLIWTPTYYEWKVNDVSIRRFNQNETYIFPDFEGKVIVSLWEAPPSTWGGPGINWLSAPFDLFITNLDIICCNNINNSLKLDNSMDDDSHKMVNNSYLITFNYMYLILNAIFSIYILRE